MFARRRIRRLSNFSNPSYSSGLAARERRAQFFVFLSKLIIFGVIAFVVLIVISFVVFARDLPSPYRLTNRDSVLSTKIYDRNDKLLYDIYGNQNRALVSLSDLPPFVKQATISIEDKNFYSHRGFSPLSYLRVFYELLVNHRLQGGSTLTQQVSKNVLLSPERTITRKIKEFILAIQVERKYSKDEILQIYLNEVPYGGTAWGIEAASETYFSKKAKDLTLTEAVVLAGLPQSPSFYSPYGTHPKAYIDRATSVTRRMREDNYITKDQEDQIKKELPDVKFSPSSGDLKAAHFVFYVRDQLVERYGERAVEQGGLQVKTTLDLTLQEKAQQIVADEIAKLKAYKVGNGAAIVTDPKTGEILAMVGSKDYFAKDYDGKVNVVMSQRQPGSSIKPVTYATAFKQGYTPSTVIADVPTEFPGGSGQPPYRPVNYDGKFHGFVQLRFALGDSFNLPAVKMLANVGLKNMLQTGYDMGLTTLEPTNRNLERFGLSVTLGGGEVRLLDMATAYGVFASSGAKHDPVAILSVKDAKGKTLEEFKPDSGKKVLSPEVSFLISHILSDNNARSEAFGPSSSLVVPGRTVAVKTGTTDDKRDNWTIGYTPSYVVGVWVGNNDNSPMNPQIASGVTGASPIWNKITRFATKDKVEDFSVPSGVEASIIDAFGGGLPCRSYPTRSEYFIKGTTPNKDCVVEQKIKVSRSDPSRVANSDEVSRGDYDEREYFVLPEKDPVSTDGVNRWQIGIENWAAGQPDAHYHTPKGVYDVAISSDNSVYVSITTPQNEAVVSGSTKISVVVTTNGDIDHADLLVDGDKKQTQAQNSKSFDFTYNFDGSGDHVVSVVVYRSGSGYGVGTINVHSPS